MTKITIAEAEALTGKSVKTLHRHTKNGTLSFSLNPQGQKVVDIVELERVYGQLKQPVETAENGTGEHLTPVENNLELVETIKQQVLDQQSHIDALQAELKDVKAEKRQLLNAVENLTLMFPKPEPTPEPKPPGIFARLASRCGL